MEIQEEMVKLLEERAVRGEKASLESTKTPKDKKGN